jgi:hypothetical protein
VKRSEIKVGEEYASTRSRDWTQWWNAKRVRVVDLGPFREESQYAPRMVDVGVIDGTPTKDNYRRDAKGTYVAVRYLDDNFTPQDRVRFVSVTHLKTTWADYLETKDATAKARLEQDEREAKRKEAVAAERAEIATLADRVGLGLTDPGNAHWDDYNRVVLSRSAFRALLTAALAGQPAEEATR